MSVAKAFLDLIGTPALVAKTTNDLTVGTAGTGTLRVISNSVLTAAFIGGYSFKKNIAAAISAAGTSSQANSTLIAAEVNLITTAAANSGVRLPVGAAGQQITIFNAGASTVNIYPEVGGNIDAAGADTAVTLAANKGLQLTCISALVWKSVHGA